MRKTEASGCKINLYLRVTGCRADGYHTLATCFWPLAAPSDRITVEDRTEEGIEFRSSAPELPTDSRNLAVAAAQRYAEAAGLRPHWRIILDKHLPIAAGVGGGSADAGAVLRILETEYRRLGARRLSELALALGADVPFFLAAPLRPAFARGIGEELRPLPPARPLHLVLAAPGFPVSAKWSYRHLDPARIGPEDAGIEENLSAALAAGDAHRIAGLLRNDLEAALYRKFPQLELIRETMLDAGAVAAAVSGSGPTLFALAADAGSRRAVADALRRRFAGDEVMKIFETGKTPDHQETAE